MTEVYQSLSPDEEQEPPPPVTVKPEYVTSDCIRLSWRPPKCDLRIVGYTVSYGLRGMQRDFEATTWVMTRFIFNHDMELCCLRVFIHHTVYSLKRTNTRCLVWNIWFNVNNYHTCEITFLMTPCAQDPLHNNLIKLKKTTLLYLSISRFHFPIHTINEQIKSDQPMSHCHLLFSFEIFVLI